MPLVIGGSQNGVHGKEDFFLDSEEFLEILVILGKSLLPAFHRRLLGLGKRDRIRPQILTCRQYQFPYLA